MQSSRKLFIRWFVLAVGSMAFCGLLSAQDTTATLRETRLQAMRDRAESLRLMWGKREDVYRVNPTPLLRYNDPTQTTTDGTLWMWEVDQRPVAALCLFSDSREGFQWNYELVTLTREKLIVGGRRSWRWMPSPIERKSLVVESIVPAKTPALRLTQMKTIAASYQMESRVEGNVDQARILPSPVHRYSAPATDVSDGAVFLFVTGTNPEVWMQIEQVQGTWQITFARLSAGELTIRNSNNDVVWTAARIREWNPQHKYFSHYGPDRDAMD